MLRMLRAANVQVFRRLHDKAIHAQQQQASEKRQGTKSREVSTVGAASYGELALRRTVAMVDFGGRKWLGRAVEGYGRLFGRPGRGSRHCFMVALEEG